MPPVAEPLGGVVAEELDPVGVDDDDRVGRACSAPETLLEIGGRAIGVACRRGPVGRRQRVRRARFIRTDR